MNEPKTVIATKPTKPAAREPRTRLLRATCHAPQPTDGDGATRVCSGGLQHALLARERAALDVTRSVPAATAAPRATRETSTRPAAQADARHDVRPRPPRLRQCRSALLQPRILALLAGASCALCLAWVGLHATRPASETTRISATSAAARERTRPASETTKTASARPTAPDQDKPPVTPTAPVPLPASAAGLLASGDYVHAAQAYRALAAARPDEPAYAAVRSVLEHRLAQRRRLHAAGSQAVRP